MDEPVVESKYDQVFELVSKECGAQLRKWGRQNHDPLKWVVILGEEVGEACKAALEEEADLHLTELIHVAAVAVSAAECFLRLQEKTGE